MASMVYKWKIEDEDIIRNDGKQQVIDDTAKKLHEAVIEVSIF